MGRKKQGKERNGKMVARNKLSSLGVTVNVWDNGTLVPAKLCREISQNGRFKKFRNNKEYPVILDNGQTGLALQDEQGKLYFVKS